ncbi:N-acetylphosphatidylethanolamine-hydrolyzing phospholipase D [Malassezia caprae]|uniref:N-acetylphosphatidylethanolamine-hydrolyzing phospholipase D n=1 Tax=Malassezia caprae TaxID=1381934 RepID=A0AAF0IWE3_9BASI|nr:N-acetylphosphatidylethanolamine-hydrolyzing phospholipase D [Malassezia caprae]
MSLEAAATQLARCLPPWRKSAFVLGSIIGVWTGAWCLQELTRVWTLSARRRRHPVRSRTQAACTDSAWLGHADEQERHHIIARFRPLLLFGRYLDVAPAKRPRAWLSRRGRAGPADRALEAQHPLSVAQLWGTHGRTAAALGRGCSYTWLAQDTCLIQMHGLTLLTDPVFHARSRTPCTLSELVEKGRVDVIVVTRHHAAHLDLSIVPHVPHTRWIVPRGMRTQLMRRGVDAAQITELTWWDETHMPFSVPVRDATASVRDVERRLDVAAVPTGGRSGRALSQSYVVRCAARGQRTVSVFFGGDSTYSGALYEAIGHMYGPFDVASFPISEGSGPWPCMDVHGAERAAADVGAAQRMGRVRGGRWGRDTSSVRVVPRGVTQIVADV